MVIPDPGFRAICKDGSDPSSVMNLSVNPRAVYPEFYSPNRRCTTGVDLHLIGLVIKLWRFQRSKDINNVIRINC